MEYTVQKLAQLAGVSPRTLRYYHEIGILKPARINSSGYRIYGQQEVDRLQQILFYRELGVDLESIGQLLDSPSFDELKALQDHREKLLEKRRELEVLLTNINNTIAAKEGRIKMKDQEKFAGFKKELLADNERLYGKEIREKYGQEAVTKSNTKLKNMTQKEYEQITALEEKIIKTIHKAMDIGDPASEIAQKAADLHRQWISFYWDSYTQEAHRGVAQMYVDDERFTAYYDQKRPGTARFLRDAIFIYTDTN